MLILDLVLIPLQFQHSGRNYSVSHRVWFLAFQQMLCQQFQNQEMLILRFAWKFLK